MTVVATLVPAQHTAGDPRHGVVRFARDLAAALGRPLLCDGAPPPGEPVHVHFTERLWGAGPEDAAAAMEALAARGPVTVTLHDLPQPTDGPGRYARRVAAYRRVVRAARGVAVSSAHERRLLRVHVGAEAGVVVPLPVDPVGRAVRPAPAPEVGVLGWLYPGKGHREVLDAVAALGVDGLAVVALGAVSPGHDADAAALAVHATALGVPFAVTGWLEDDALVARCRRVAVPVAAHRNLSASASIASWIAAGRRPLVVDSPYARELEALRPGTVTRFAPHALASAVAAALGDPDRTWLAPGVAAGGGIAEAAERYRAWWAEVAW